MQMEYRGIEYTITEGTRPSVWKWRVLVGDPGTARLPAWRRILLRMGEAPTEASAEARVREIIDRAFNP
jgi:hypothetical protein